VEQLTLETLIRYSIETRIKQHHQHKHSYHLAKPTAEHSINFGFHFLPQETDIIAKKFRCMDQIIMKVMETELHANMMNREDGFSFSSSQKPLIHTLKGTEEGFSKERCWLGFQPPTTLEMAAVIAPSMVLK
jgi:hypothetical protein